MAAVKDYYKILGVKEDASADAIKKAYRALAREHHPDRNPDDGQAEERFKEIQEANDILSDDEKRREYDMRRRNPFGQGQGQGQGPGFSTGAGSRFYKTPDGTFVRFDAEEGNGSDPLGGFTDLFGRMFSGGARTSGRGRDIDTIVRLSFNESIQGGKKEVLLPSNERIRINVPKGVHDGFRIRLRERGHSGIGGRGDLYVTFRVTPSPRFERKEDDLYVVESVSVFEAMLGTMHEVTTAYGKTIKLSIPAGTQPGDRLRVRNQGVVTDDGRGDLYVEVRVTVPKDLTDKQKEILESARKDARI
jgi:DnaJ-class molecular chaperone